jgi:hypothetical protein
MKRTRVKMLIALGLFFLLLFMNVPQATAQSCLPAPSGLVGWWDGDSVSATTAFDISDHGNDGTITGNVEIVPGLVGNAFDLDGTRYTRVSGTFIDGFSGGAAPITLSAWFYQPASVGHPGKGVLGVGSRWFKAHFFQRLSTGIGAHNPSWVCLDGPVGQNRLCLGADNARDRWWGSNTVIDNETWHHIASTYDPTTKTASMYIDGALDRVTTIAGGLSLGTKFWIGGDDYNDNFFDGLIDEAQVYNRVLEASEIQAIFDAGTAGVCKGLSVAVDIKPGSDPNSINPRNRGVIPVAILTTDSFDAVTVDPNTVLFGWAGTETAPVHFGLEDVDGDGNTDATFHFTTQATGIQCGDTSATLSGETYSGQTIQGSDTIRTVGCK